MHLHLKSLHISQSEINISCHRSTWDIIGDYPKEPRISFRTARSNYPEAILRKISIIFMTISFKFETKLS